MNRTKSIALSFTMLALSGLSTATAQVARDSIANRFTVSSAMFVLPDSQERPRAVEYSDRYYTLLRIHRIASYAVLPVFAVQYAAGDQLLKGDAPGWARPTHDAGTATLAALFGFNAVSGVWNLWDSRNDKAGRTRRFMHVGLMTVATAGLLWSAQSAPDNDDDENGGVVVASSDRGTRHRDIALGAMGVASVGTVIMWLWK
jgi:hypothetical protein